MQPPDGVWTPTSLNRARKCYVPVEVVQKLIDATPDPEWKLLLAMARFLGLRTPSEPFSLTWADVLWGERKLRIPSPKTERQGKPWRVVPLLPVIEHYLRPVFEAAQEGTAYIFHRLRQRDSARKAAQGFWGAVNLRQQLLKLIARAGLQPWPKLWHSLRASAQTDLTQHLGVFVACEFVGNTKAVAVDHYLTVREQDFERALSLPFGAAPSTGDGGVARQVARAALLRSDTEQMSLTAQGSYSHSLSLFNPPNIVLSPPGVAGAGFEPAAFSQEKSGVSESGGAKSGAVSAGSVADGPDLDALAGQLAAILAALPADQRAELVRRLAGGGGS